MIRSIVMYQVLCDYPPCGNTASADIGFLDLNVAEDIAVDEGYQTIRTAKRTDSFPGIHYCPEHRSPSYALE